MMIPSLNVNWEIILRVIASLSLVVGAGSALSLTILASAPREYESKLPRQLFRRLYFTAKASIALGGICAAVAGVISANLFLVFTGALLLPFVVPFHFLEKKA